MRFIGFGNAQNKTLWGSFVLRIPYILHVYFTNFCASLKRLKIIFSKEIGNFYVSSLNIFEIVL